MPRTKDFKPISMVGGFYRLLVKVLTNRLRKVMGRVVSKFQNVFIKGRQILDVTLIANEVINSMQRNNSSGVVCKLDIKKVFDHVN